MSAAKKPRKKKGAPAEPTPQEPTLFDAGVTVPSETPADVPAQSPADHAEPATEAPVPPVKKPRARERAVAAPRPEDLPDELPLPDVEPAEAPVALPESQEADTGPVTFEVFIRGKSQLDGDHGFEPLWMPDCMFDFQAFLTEWAIRGGRKALFEDCGLGKSLQELVYAQNVLQHANKPFLILTPLAVTQQFLTEGEKFGVEVKRIRDGRVHRGVVNVVNYEQLHRLNPHDFSGVACDECFSADTMVDVVDASGAISQARIDSIRVGDMILNASGIDVVSDVHRREVPYAVRLSIGERRIISSPNHPYFTQRGWVCAQDIEPGDSVLESRAAVRLVRENVLAQAQEQRQSAILREILLSEMAHESAGTPSKGTHARGGSATRTQALGLVEVRSSEGGSGDRTNAPTWPRRENSRGQREDIPPIERDEPRTFRAWGQRAWFDSASEDSSGCTWTELGSGVFLVTGPTGSRLSDALQARLGSSREASQYRGGWTIASFQESPGHEARREGPFARVDGLEVLEPGHHDLAQHRAPDGSLYFYDLGGTRHPSFSVGGLLVHNSSILKNDSGATRKAVTEFMRTLRYRLLGTATAAPNDLPELGTSSEALGYLGHMDMLGRFFKNDQNNSVDTGGKWRGYGAPRAYMGPKWRFRGHAEEPFWRWVCSWARSMRKPSDFGFDDRNFVLPPLIENAHEVSSAAAPPGMLFSIGARGRKEELQERRRTIKERCEMVAALVSNTGKPSISWCHLNDEGDLLEELIPGAVQVSGKDSDDEKEEKLAAFVSGQAQKLVIKPIIGAWGLNLQMCDHMTAFVSHSHEQDYQCIRRCYRFGQKNPVTVDRVLSDGEAQVLANLQRKAVLADTMFENLVRYMKDALHIQRGRTFEKELELPSWL